MPHQIVTLTLNPAIDKSTVVDQLVAEQKLRCESPRFDAGGGGINVSRGIQKLGGSSLAVFTAGGASGALLGELVKTESIDYQAIPTQNWTRENFTVTEKSTNAQYRFGMPGAALSQSEIDACLDALRAQAPAYVVGSGSLPPGVADDFYAQVAVVSKKMGARFILDTSGAPLQAACNEGVFLLKPNIAELCKLVGVENLETDQVDDAARQIIGRGGCEVVVVSLGPMGAIWVTKNECEHIPAPPVKKLSTVGAGDSMVAGMTWGLAQNKSFGQMARMGVACGSAATMNAGTQLFKPEDATKLLGWLNQYADKYRLVI